MAGLGLLDSQENTCPREVRSHLWQVKLENSRWVNYDEFNCMAISVAVEEGQTRVSVKVAQRLYELNLKSLEQINLTTGMKRPVRRVSSAWQVKLDNDNWTNYDDRTNRILSAAKQSGQTRSSAHIGGRAYELNLDSLEQVNLMTGKCRPIRQIGPGTDKASDGDRPVPVKVAVPPPCRLPSVMVAAYSFSVRQHLLSSSLEKNLNKY
eukprot:TRINITY_DN21331_c0_g1_i1.p1 TRINITY_DN21331_c0_g1~~TRINITY_DN21331_c0_g1_i1.p1  ORF type:complete len:208 (+),score=32.58 TRINITY_DN21331_c0_g1_i1:66-689(+)